VRAPFWLYLLAAQFIDFLMLALVTLGLEKLEPGNFLEVAFATMTSDMFISHDIVPVLIWAALFGLAVYAVMRNHVVALWCAALVLAHEVFNLLVGFEHHVLGPDTAAVGLNLYNNAPVSGLLIEAGICAGLVFWFCRRRAKRGAPASWRLQIGLYGVLVGSTLATLLIAHRPPSAWLGW